MRNLVVCCDGTWNSLTNKDGQFPALTNVVRIHAAVGPVSTDGKEQLKYYREGVGNRGNLFERTLDGATGWRLTDDIESAYKWVAENFRRGATVVEDDRIFLFGFSRGAYTVRSLAGMISDVGLADLTAVGLTEPAKWAKVKAAMARYQNRKMEKREAQKSGKKVAAEDNGEYRPKIHFVGVWDTVGALGIPGDLGLLKGLLSQPDKHLFHDTVLSDNVVHARHAVAIDERRLDFTPTLWDLPEKPRPAGSSFAQVWFAGVHADVGGGYFLRGLGDVALEWMMLQAGAQTLGFRENELERLKVNPRGQLHDSLEGTFKHRPSRPRSVPNLADRDLNIDIVSPRVFDRAEEPAPAEDNYWKTHDLGPGEEVTVDVAARDRWGWTGIYLREGETYDLRAQGEWMDGKLKIGPGGVRSEARALGHRLGEMSEMVRDGLRKISGSDKTMPLFLDYGRRTNENWFALIGVVANGAGVDPTSMETRDHEPFLIGEERLGFQTVGKGGYLYTYANDAWRRYHNNKGMLKLTVKRRTPG